MTNPFRRAVVRVMALLPVAALALWAVGASAEDAKMPLPGNSGSVSVPAKPEVKPVQQGAPSPSQESGPSQILSPEAGQELLFLLVLAALIEQALGLVFNWKPFVASFDRKAVRPLISFAVCLVVTSRFDPPLLGHLLPPGVLSTILTAMILGGGSAAVNNLLKTLGLRDQLPAADAVPQGPRPPADKAWIAVIPKVKTEVTGTLTVVGTVDGSTDVVQLGQVSAEAARTGRRWGLLLANKGRFPPVGGHAIAPGTWTIWLESTRLKAAPSPPPVTSENQWGPYKVEAGSIIDITLTI